MISVPGLTRCGTARYQLDFCFPANHCQCRPMTLTAVNLLRMDLVPVAHSLETMSNIQLLTCRTLTRLQREDRSSSDRSTGSTRSVLRPIIALIAVTVGIAVT